MGLKTDMGDLFKSKGRGQKETRAARGCGENGGGTSTATTTTGEREEQRRACCTSVAVPGPPGKAAITRPEALKDGEVWAWTSARA